MANTKRYYWLKLPKNFFGEKEIKKLRKIAGGDTYTIIYLKMALLSMNNGGILFFDNIEEDFVSEIALELDEDIDNVKITISYLQSVGLLEYKEVDELFLTAVPSMIGSEAASTARSRKSRNNKKLLQCNTIATQCNTEREKEIETETDKDKEKEEKTIYQQIADIYKDTCVSFPPVKILTHERIDAINDSLDFYTLEDFKTLFAKAEASNFLKGGNERNWCADFSWLIKAGNMAKVLEGNFDNKPAQPKKNGFNNFTQRQHDADAMERMLLNSQSPPATVGTDESIRKRAEALQKQLSEVKE